ncbi:hypothetical protein AVEN_274026-1 [Araneus ventricosus]|uniref:Uncharacterized protein n=1 Tax=Araneus ventricosus TaxID=182803 RepID=A0A4Y2EK98_ARAVE|nr:hypothetical protein AVEN_274026-1 [Araneus ventricosus]
MDSIEILVFPQHTNTRPSLWSLGSMESANALEDFNVFFFSECSHSEGNCSVYNTLQSKKTPFATSLNDHPCLLELENCPLNKFFIRGKSHMGQDQGNKLVVEVPEYDALKGNLTPRRTSEPAHYPDGALTTWPSKDLVAFVSQILKMFKDFNKFFFSECTTIP